MYCAMKNDRCIALYCAMKNEESRPRRNTPSGLLHDQRFQKVPYQWCRQVARSRIFSRGFRKNPTPARRDTGTWHGGMQPWYGVLVLVLVVLHRMPPQKKQIGASVFSRQVGAFLERFAEICVAAVHFGGPQDFEPPAKPPKSCRRKTYF